MQKQNIVTQSHRQVRERKINHTKKDVSREITFSNTLLSIYFINSRIMKQYNSFSHKRTFALCEVSHTNIGKIGKMLRKITFLHCVIHPRSPTDSITDLYNFLIIQLIFIFPLTSISTGPSSELTCNNYL